MTAERLLWIVLGPWPSHRNPITVEQLRALAATRGDIEVQVGETGSRTERDFIATDPTRKAAGKLTLIDGRLQMRNPDDRTIEWMLALATRLREE